MVDVAGLFLVIATGFGLAFGTELLQYLLIYRTQSFRTLKANLEKHAAKVEEARDGNTTSSTSSRSKAVKKREARLQDWEDEAAKQLAAMNMKSGIIVMVTVLLSWRYVPRLFGNAPVARLPFEPPAFMRKATQRGLVDADVRDASALFIFMLCQACMRAVLSKVLTWGPTRRMNEVKPTIPKALKMN